MLLSAASVFLGMLYCALNGEGAEYNAIFLVLLVNSILINLRFGMQNRYEYLLKSKKTIVAGNAALTVGGFLQLAAISFRLPVLAIACITTFTSLMTLLMIYIQYRLDFEKLIQGTIKWNLVKALIAESAPFAVAASCAIIYSRCDSIMIGNMLSKEEVGIYAIAVKLISILQIGISPVRESVYPQMIELYMTNPRQYARKFVQITSLMTWFYIVGAGLSMLILPTAFRLLRPEYYRAFDIYQIYVLGSFFMYNAALRAGHFTLIHRGNILMISQLISVALNVFLNYFGIKIFGAYGAAFATAITQGISLLFCNLLFGEDGREVFRWQIEALNPCSLFKKSSAG